MFTSIKFLYDCLHFFSFGSSAKDSSISGPVRLRSYYVVADYKDTSNKFSIPEGTVVQVVQKDASGTKLFKAMQSIVTVYMKITHPYSVCMSHTPLKKNNVSKIDSLGVISAQL